MMPASSGRADAIRPHSTAWASNMGSMAGVQSNVPGEPQPMQGFRPLQQLQNLPGISPNQSALQSFDGGFLRHVVQMAPIRQMSLNAVQKPVHQTEPEEQVQTFSQKVFLCLSPPVLS